ncbi:class A sortase [Peptostreptococcus stomatis]|uniref:class A sortase n=1 Tax=Peptostreptococcus stomatis TaxID=341694 RepID=UPI003FA0A445
MKKLGLLLILVGIMFVSVPKISEYILMKRSQDVNITQVSGEDLEKNTKEKTSNYDASKVDPIDINGVILNRDKADLSKLVGQLVIPSINKNIAIFEGLENNNLMYGACTMKPGQRMGQGNYAVAGHYCKNDKVLFGGLMKIKEGDIIKLTNKKNIYEYRVVKTMKVKEDRTDLIGDGLLGQYEGRAIVSLMTCYYDEDGYRYFVIGSFSKLYPYSQERMLDGISQ